MAQRQMTGIILDKRRNGIEASRQQASHFRKLYFSVSRRMEALSKLIHEHAEELPRELYIEVRIILEAQSNEQRK